MGPLAGGSGGEKGCLLMERGKYIVIEGPIGVGKTSLVNLLTKRFSARRILEAAEDVFAEHGFEAAKVQQIAERARLSMGTIYSIFPGMHFSMYL